MDLFLDIFNTKLAKQSNCKKGVNIVKIADLQPRGVRRFELVVSYSQYLPPESSRTNTVGSPLQI